MWSFALVEPKSPRMSLTLDAVEYNGLSPSFRRGGKSPEPSSSSAGALASGSHASWSLGDSSPFSLRSSTLHTSSMQRSAAPKKKHRAFTFWDACRDPRIHLVIGGYFFFQLAIIANSFWLPTFLKRFSSLPPTTVARLVIFPAIGGLVGLIVNAWHSDKTGERKWHAAIPVLCAGVAFLLIIAVHLHFALVVLLFTLGSGFYFASIPCIWSIPTTILSGTTAAAAFGLITSVSQIGAFVGPSLIGYLNDRSHSILPGIALIGVSFVVAALIFSGLRLTPLRQNENCARIKVGEAT